jgi:hypothetical protein
MPGEKPSGKALASRLNPSGGSFRASLARQEPALPQVRHGGMCVLARDLFYKATAGNAHTLTLSKDKKFSELSTYCRLNLTYHPKNGKAE